MRLLLTFFVILVHTAFPASGDSGAALLMHEAFGPVDAGDALGNGGLTVTFSATGRIAGVQCDKPRILDPAIRVFIGLAEFRV